MASVSVIKMRSLVLNMKSVSKFAAKWNRALSDVRNAVHESSFVLQDAVPVNCCGDAFSLVRQVNHNNVVFADVNRRCRQLEVDRQIAASNAVALNAVFDKTLLIILDRTVHARSVTKIFLFSLTRIISPTISLTRPWYENIWAWTWICRFERRSAGTRGYILRRAPRDPGWLSLGPRESWENRPAFHSHWAEIEETPATQRTGTKQEDKWSSFWKGWKMTDKLSLRQN